MRGTPRDSLTDHPSKPDLVVEIADSSLRFDRTVKAMAYARAGVADYWIVDLRQRVVEVRREPVRAGRRSRYARLVVAGPGEAISPLAAPGARIAVADLLP